MDEFIMNVGNGSVRRLISMFITKVIRAKTNVGTFDAKIDKINASSKDGMVMLEVNARIYVSAEELADKLKKGELL